MSTIRELIISATQQSMIAGSLVSAGKFLGSKVKVLSFLNFDTHFKNLAGSAFLISASFKCVDFFASSLIHQNKTLQSRALGVRTTLSAIGGFTSASLLSKLGILPNQYKIPFVFLSTMVYLFIDGQQMIRNQAGSLFQLHIKNLGKEELQKLVDEVKKSMLADDPLENRALQSQAKENLHKKIVEEERRILGGKTLTEYVQEKIKFEEGIIQILINIIFSKATLMNIDILEATVTFEEAKSLLNAPIAAGFTKKLLRIQSEEEFNQLKQYFDTVSIDSFNLLLEDSKLIANGMQGFGEGPGNEDQALQQQMQQLVRNFETRPKQEFTSSINSEDDYYKPD